MCAILSLETVMANVLSSDHNLFGTVRRLSSRPRAFWQRVSEGLAVSELWRQFLTDARVSYSLYSREVDWESFDEEPRTRRAMHIARSLFWALLMKLSPPRRVFLMIALLFTLVALSGAQPFGWPREVHILLAAG